jgi:broad specificity phosphatase PhoE
MIYLLRHGQTEFNLAGRYQGRLDSALTARGEAQAAEMGRVLAARIDPTRTVIQTSPLPRAVRTAAIIADQLGVQPVVDARLIEVALGVWEGRTAAEIDEGWPGVRDGFRRNEWFFNAPGGEDYPTVERRLSNLLAELPLDQTVAHVLVTHALSGRVLRGLHAGLEPHRAMRLEIPQDAFFSLHPGGDIQRIDCALPV